MKIPKLPVFFSSWAIKIATLFLIAAAACSVFAWLNSAGSRDEPLKVEIVSKPKAKELIVLVHAYRGSIKAMEQVRDAIQAVRPDADILQFEYPAQMFSNANLASIASQMEAKIDVQYQARQYERIILSGYSIGALLVRKAYVYGHGKIEDTPGSNEGPDVSRPPKVWTTKVDRFVLLAGMNRGWSREGTQSGAAFGSVFRRLGLGLGRLTGTATLIRQAERGEPFIANLRLQWLDVMQKMSRDSRPTVIQLLGDRDDVVSPEDSKDVNVARDFIWVQLNNTGHGTIATLGDDGSGLERKQKIQAAFGGRAAVEQLRRNSAVMQVAEDPDVESVVFVLHGIRDMAEWTSQFERPLQDAYHAKHPEGKTKLRVHRAQYGYFGMGPFLLWEDRQKNVRWFMDEVTELKAQFPNLKEINFIGHSYGTYILASALRKYATLRIHRAALAGSVIRRDFPWSRFTGRIGQVRNYVGSADSVVGWGPRVFEMPVFNLVNQDIGSAGFNGFTDGFATSMETRFVQGAHAAALQKENIPSIVQFIINGEKVDVASLHAETHPGWLEFLSNICWVLWIAAAFLIFWGGFKLPIVSTRVMQHVSPHTQISPQVLAWVSRGTYVFLLWLILSTI